MLHLQLSGTGAVDCQLASSPKSSTLAPSKRLTAVCYRRSSSNTKEHFKITRPVCRQFVKPCSRLSSNAVPSCNVSKDNKPTSMHIISSKIWLAYSSWCDYHQASLTFVAKPCLSAELMRVMWVPLCLRQLCLHSASGTDVSMFAPWKSNKLLHGPEMAYVVQAIGTIHTMLAQSRVHHISIQVRCDLVTRITSF